MNEEKVTLTIDKIIWEKFKRYCAANAFKISGKIQLLLNEEIERGPKTKNLLDMFREIVEKESKRDAVRSEQTHLNTQPIVNRDSGFQNNGNHYRPEARQVVIVRHDPKMRNGERVPTIDQLMKRRNG